MRHSHRADWNGERKHSTCCEWGMTLVIAKSSGLPKPFCSKRRTVELLITAHRRTKSARRSLHKPGRNCLNRS